MQTGQQKGLSLGEVGSKAGPRKTIGCSAGLGGEDLRPGAGREGTGKKANECHALKGTLG